MRCVTAFIIALLLGEAAAFSFQAAPCFGRPPSALSRTILQQSSASDVDNLSPQDESTVDVENVSDEKANGSSSNVTATDLSSSEEDDTSATEQAPGVEVTPTDDTESTKDLLSKLLLLASSCGRGEFATESQKDQALSLIQALESRNPTLQPTTSPLIQGKWTLLYSSTQLFRSSPFFMAGRAVCSTEDQAQQYDWFCDMHREALAISNIGAVRQIISNNRMISEFEVKAGAVPFLADFTPFTYSGGLPVTIDGAIVSSADITPAENGASWEIFMDTVEIKGSNIPGLRQLLDSGVKLQSRDLGEFLEDNVSGYTNPKPIFETTYLDESIRISRDQDGKVFVYGKTSDDSTPTDYSNVTPDLGFIKLLQGFNDAVTKFYL